MANGLAGLGGPATTAKTAWDPLQVMLIVAHQVCSLDCPVSDSSSVGAAFNRVLLWAGSTLHAQVDSVLVCLVVLCGLFDMWGFVGGNTVDAFHGSFYSA